MKNYMVIELDNNVKYLVVDMLEWNEKKYFLLTMIMSDGYSLDNEFDICLYNNIKDIFYNRLSEQGQKLKSLDSDSIFNMIELRVININEFEYTLKNMSGQIITMNMEIFGDFKIQINDYVYMREETTKENIMVRFGAIYKDSAELIKIKRGDSIHYLQRYYG